MRESSIRRTFYAGIFAVAAGLLVAFGNPVDHVRADLHADGRGVASTLEFAARVVLRGSTDRPIALRPGHAAAQAFPVARAIVSKSQ